MNDIKVSVIIPSYNHSKFIKKAIDSVLKQTYRHFELIILDDCSTDSSAKIINSYKDKRIKKFFNKENFGAVDTLNQLIDLATGEYIAVLNSDDYWEAEKLEKQVKYLDDNPNIVACFTWADFIDENNKVFYESSDMNLDLFQKNNRKQSEWFRYLFDNGNCLCHPSVMIRSEIYSKIGKYKNIYKQLPDFEFWIRLIKKFNIHIIEENLTHFRILKESGNNSSYLNEENKNIMNYEMFMIKNEFLDDCDNKLFFEAFEDKIIRKYCLENSKMIEFEKCFILYQSRYYKQLGRFIGYYRIGKLLLDNKTALLIEKTYDFKLKDYYSLGKFIVNLDVQYFEQHIVEKIPDYIINSRSYRWGNKIRSTKMYIFTLKIRKKLRKILTGE